MNTRSIAPLRISLPIFLLFCGWTLLATAFVLGYHAQESTIYAWDFDNYPRKFRLLIEGLHVDGYLATLKNVINSLEDDYTLLPSFMLMPLGLIFGADRGVYLAGVASLYGFVALGMTLALYRSLCRIGEYELDKADWIVATICLVTMPLFWRPILRGYPDVLGMGIISGLLLVHLVRPVWARPFMHMLLMGIAIAGLLWFRRWYAYFIAAAMLAVLVDFVWIFAAQKNRWEVLRSLVLKGAVAMGTAVVLLFAVSAQRWLDNLNTSYRDLYSSVRTESWHDIFFMYYHHIGFLTLVFVVLGLYFSSRAWGLRAALFIGVFLVAGFSLFQRTQDLGSHHLYGLLPAIAVLFLAGAVGLRRCLAAAAYRATAAVVIVALFVLQLAAVTTPRVWDGAGMLRAAFPENILPLRRDDLGEIRRLLDTLRDEIRPGEKIYVVSSSYIFNGDVVKSAAETWHYGPEITKHIFYTQEIDSRDKFPTRFFEAKLAIVATPFQYHLRPSEQRNVGMLVEKFGTDAAFQSHFQRHPQTFNLDRGVTVSVYRLTQPFDNNELQALQQEYFR